MKSILSARHPLYTLNLLDWQKYRRTLEGGKNFVNYYLKKFSIREDGTDFTNRQLISYCPAHAKAALIDIKNAIYQRLSEITRVGGSASYQKAVKGLNGGVDYAGRTMTNFIGTQVLLELIGFGKVGIYVDRPWFSESPTKSETLSKQPYLYYYKAEEILAWNYNQNILTTVLLEDVEDVEDEYDLVYATIKKYRLLTLTENGVVVQFFDNQGRELLMESGMLALKRIPFVIGEISQSLLTDVADYQIALLNLESSDISYSLKSNFPFYVEQFNPAMENLKAIQTEADAETGEPARENVSDAGKENIRVGATSGRRYPKGLERPSFIHPSSEPLQASMEKQKQLKEDIKQLVNLSLRNLERPAGSQPADLTDQKGLEAGLSYIGLELEKIENEIAKIWADYEKNEELAEIKYPKKYSLKTESERRIEATDLNKLKETIPSITFQKEISIQISKILLEDKVSEEKINTISKEITDAKVIVTDHDTLRQDYEAGLVSGDLASQAAGYPKGDFEQAKLDHADRAARIAEAQAKVSNRGVKDLQNLDDEKVDKIDKDRRGASSNE